MKTALAAAPGAARLQPFRHLYLHVPFCRHKCGYCDFNAYAGLERLMPDYVRALAEELAGAAADFRFAALRTVYLGGGTPSLLPPAEAALLLRAVRATFALEPCAEVTLEANPASTDEERLAAWRDGGVNRLSLGAQGFDRRALAVLERRTDGAMAVRAFGQARRAGFANVSLDLIYGVPFQSAASWRDTLERALELEPEHLSCYCLSFEEGTLLTRRLAAGRLPAPDADAQWELLEATAQALDAAGYRRYEVSSWARPGFESRHNRAYWECRPVYGAGAGAHSYASEGRGGRAWRWWNVMRPREYVAALANARGGAPRSGPHARTAWLPGAPGPVPAPRLEGEELAPPRAAAERLMLGLRTAAGLRPPPGFEAPLQELRAAGLVARRGARWAPTRRGLDLHNQVALAVL